MELQDVLYEDLMVFDLKSKKKEAAIRELAGNLSEQGCVSDLETYLAAVFKREEEFTTGLGMGIAIPHGKSAAVKTSAVCFGKSKEGVDYQAEDGKPVHLLFLIAVGENSGEEHLRILAKISRKLIHEQVRSELMKAETAEAVYQALR